MNFRLSLVTCFDTSLLSSPLILSHLSSRPTSHLVPAKWAYKQALKLENFNSVCTFLPQRGEIYHLFSELIGAILFNSCRAEKTRLLDTQKQVDEVNSQLYTFINIYGNIEPGNESGKG